MAGVDPHALLLVLLAVLVGALAKGVTGSGLPTVAIPVLAPIIGVEAAVVVMALPTVVTNTQLLWTHRSSAPQSRHLGALLWGGGLGAILGAWVLTSVSERVLSLGLAGIIALYLVLALTRPGFTLEPDTTRRLAPPVGVVAGVLQGSTGIAGPAVATFAHALRLPPPAYVFSVAAQFQVFALVSIVAFGLLGLYSVDRLVWSAVAVVPAMLALPLGVRVGARLDARRFGQVILVLLAVMGAKLLFDGLSP